MNEETSDPMDETAADGVAGEGALPPLMIGAQYIKDLSFENPQGPETLASLQENPQISVEVNTNARHLGESVYEVSLFIRGEAEANEKPVFIVELTYGAIVTVGDVDEDHVRPLLLIEVPRHLFPFARGIVANVTRDGGFPPLLINPLDFALLYMEQHGEPAEAAG